MNRDLTLTSTRQVIDWPLLLVLVAWLVCVAVFFSIPSPVPAATYRLHGMMTVNVNGDIVGCSDNAAAIIGHRREEVVGGANVFLFLPERMQKTARQYFEQGWNGPPYSMPTMTYPIHGGTIKVIFRRAGEYTAEATFTKEIR